MASFQKICVGLIGLNAPYTDTPTGTNWAANAHLPYLLKSSKYELVALQNSTAERAVKAIKAHGLDPEKVKAYGTPEDLANDPNVDLVVSSIRVDRHGGSIIPSIKAGKDVYVEWPVEANYAIAKELTDLVKAHKVRNVVGLQGSFSLIIKKVKALIDSGEIGRIESSTVVSMARGGPTIPAHIGYFIDKKVGGNTMTIAFGHSIEFITDVLGGVKYHKSLLVNQYPEIAVVDPKSSEVLETRKNDVPTQIILDAILESDVVLSYKLHNSATPSPGAKPRNDKNKPPSLDWRIFGSKGEIRITSIGSWAVNAGIDNFKVEIYRVDDGVLEEVDIGVDEFEHLPLVSRNIARLYEAFAAGQGSDGEKKEWYPDFEHALKKHELIEDMYNSNGF